MVEVPLFALGLQPGGSMTLSKAQHYIDTCRSRQHYIGKHRSWRKLYRVQVMESGDPSPRTLASAEGISQWAYARAIAALEQCKEAAGGIGLQSSQFRLVAGDRIIPVRMAAAALVLRHDLHKPIILVATNDNIGNQARLVAQALSAWSKRSTEVAAVRGPLINEMVRTAAGRFS